MPHARPPHALQCGAYSITLLRSVKAKQAVVSSCCSCGVLADRPFVLEGHVDILTDDGQRLTGLGLGLLGLEGLGHRRTHVGRKIGWSPDDQFQQAFPEELHRGPPFRIIAPNGRGEVRSPKKEKGAGYREPGKMEKTLNQDADLKVATTPTRLPAAPAFRRALDGKPTCRPKGRRYTNGNLCGARNIRSRLRFSFRRLKAS